MRLFFTCFLFNYMTWLTIVNCKSQPPESLLNKECVEASDSGFHVVISTYTKLSTTDDM